MTRTPPDAPTHATPVTVETENGPVTAVVHGHAPMSPETQDAVKTMMKAVIEASRCKWCGTPFKPVERGGKKQEFHQPSCRHAFHNAARRYTEALIADGYLTADALRKWAESNVHGGEKTL